MATGRGRKRCGFREDDVPPREGKCRSPNGTPSPKPRGMPLPVSANGASHGQSDGARQLRTSRTSTRGCRRAGSVSARGRVTVTYVDPEGSQRCSGSSPSSPSPSREKGGQVARAVPACMAGVPDQSPLGPVTIAAVPLTMRAGFPVEHGHCHACALVGGRPLGPPGSSLSRPLASLSLLGDARTRSSGTAPPSEAAAVAHAPRLPAGCPRTGRRDAR